MRSSALQWERVTTPNVRRWMQRIAPAVGTGAVVAALWLMAGSSRGATQTASAPTASVVRLADISSHNGIYHASLVPPPGPIALDRQRAWTVEVRTAAGAPVEGAVLALQSWTPDDEQVAARHPRVTAELGQGRYQVEGLRFDRRGLWNVKLALAAPLGTDSLAFNLVF